MGHFTSDEISPAFHEILRLALRTSFLEDGQTLINFIVAVAIVEQLDQRIHVVGKPQAFSSDSAGNFTMRSGVGTIKLVPLIALDRCTAISVVNFFELHLGVFDQVAWC